jgi:hypothetical protein
MIYRSQHQRSDIYTWIWTSGVPLFINHTQILETLNWKERATKKKWYNHVQIQYVTLSLRLVKYQSNQRIDPRNQCLFCWQGRNMLISLLFTSWRGLAFFPISCMVHTVEAYHSKILIIFADSNISPDHIWVKFNQIKGSSHVAL